MDFKAHDATCDISMKFYNRYRMKGKPSIHGVDSQKRKIPAVELSDDAFEKYEARHVPAVYPASWQPVQ